MDPSLHQNARTWWNGWWGESFHTAKWNKDIDITGKNVGIIGTGASFAQVITIADEVETLTVFSERLPGLLREKISLLRIFLKHLNKVVIALSSGMSTGKRDST